MKHFALFGFFLGLLAVRLKSQTVLFNVSANPDAGTVTIAAAPGASLTIPQIFPNDLLTGADGFTLINLFVNTYNPGQSVGVQTGNLSVSNGSQTHLLLGQPSIGAILTPETGINNFGINFDIFTLTGIGEE